MRGQALGNVSSPGDRYLAGGRSEYEADRIGTHGHRQQGIVFGGDATDLDEAGVTIGREHVGERTRARGRNGYVCAVLIAVEGIDGAGKQTLADALEEILVDRGRNVARMSFPRYGCTPFGTTIAAALEGHDQTLLDSVEALAFAFAADRWHYWSVDRVRLGHTASTVTIADRWCASNAAYGSARLGTSGADGFADWIAELEFERFGLPRPALTVLLATGTGMAGEQRRNRDGNDGDAFEADGSLQGNALDGYRRLAQRRWGGEWIVVDPLDDGGQRRPPAELAAEVEAALIV